MARLGTTRVVTLGLVGLAALFATGLAWEPETAYWPLGLWFFGLALSMGWIMGPATDSVMGAVPEEKAGVASATTSAGRGAPIRRHGSAPMAENRRCAPRTQGRSTGG